MSSVRNAILETTELESASIIILRRKSEVRYGTTVKIGFQVLPAIANFIQSQHHNVQRLEHCPFLDVLPQDLAHRIVQTVQHAHQYQLKHTTLQCKPWNATTVYLVFVTAAHDVEKQINVAAIHASEAIQHDNLCVCTVSLVEQVLLECALLFHGRKLVFVVILCQDSVAVVIEDGYSFYDIQSRLLKNTSLVFVDATGNFLFNLNALFLKCGIHSNNGFQSMCVIYNPLWFITH